MKKAERQLKRELILSLKLVSLQNEGGLGCLPEDADDFSKLHIEGLNHDILVVEGLWNLLDSFHLFRQAARVMFKEVYLPRELFDATVEKFFFFV